MFKKNTKLIIYKVSLIVLIIFLMVFVKVYYGSIKEFYRGEKAFQGGDLEEAITHYESSIHWYTPFNSYVEKSADRLWEIGNKLENEGDYDLALKTYRYLRSSFYSVRSFYTPGMKWIELCNQKISTLMAKHEPYGKREKEKTFEERKQEALEILQEKSRPDVFWSIILEIGFVGWIVGVIAFIFNAFEKGGGFNARKALFWGSLVVLFYAIWVIGMVKA